MKKNLVASKALERFLRYQTKKVLINKFKKKFILMLHLSNLMDSIYFNKIKFIGILLNKLQLNIHLLHILQVIGNQLHVIGDMI